MEYLQIEKLALLGQGSQGKVYEVEIVGLEGKFVDKVCIVNQKTDDAFHTCEEIYQEFRIG